ncbi:MAG: hypothetical protein SH850_30910 [Planctomycetaceae bacterium]|nr:hypothetical protein [Planctomycetaceae bacterium]
MSADSPPSPDDSTQEPLPATGEAADLAEAENPAADDSDLPEWEPLSPEILEDEAIRGDFVLRWAVVGLALLWGCTEISDARVLVHVRSGEFLAAHGVLPPATDPFSITAADRQWVNLSWLFDLFAAAVNQAGPVALSLMQAVLAGTAFWLLGQAVRPGIRTWWGSICGVLALLAAYPQLELRPELMTLLGVAALLMIVIGSERPGSQGWLWWLPGLMWVWAQCDPRCWIGALLLVIYLGDALRSREAGGKSLAPPILIAVAVTLIHPFLWETWGAAWRQYAVEYPALRESYPRPSVDDLGWYPLWSSWIWERFNHRVTAALILAVAAFVVLWLNRSRVSAAHWLWFAVANLLGVLTLHELPMAALVNCALATVHGQEWYRQRFGQVYSVVNLEVAFSRGGRAVTVLAMLALAWLAISGRVDGPDGHRTGLGLSRNLANELNSLRRLDGATFDAAGFHFTLRQGDALIAAGRRSFVDHRVALFAVAGDDSLLARHRLVRRWLRHSNPPPLTPEETDVARNTLAEFQITHVLPRLNSSLAEPDYRTFVDLLANPEWALTDVLPAVAVFHRSQNDAPQWREFLASHEVNVIDRAFRNPATSNLEPQDPVLPPAWSKRLLSLDRQSLSAGTLEASHWLRLTEAGRNAPLPFQLGCATLAVRAARRGAHETPHVAEAHRMLGEAYRLLGNIEASMLGEQAGAWTNSLRYYEAVPAVRQAVALQPDNPRSAAQLFDLWQSAGKVDCTYEALTRLLELTQPDDSATVDDFTRRSALEDRQRQLADAVADIQIRSETALGEGQSRVEVAAACYQSGCVQLAVKLLKEDAVLLEQQPQIRLLLTRWLAELGAGDELIDSANRLQAVSPQLGGLPWRDPVAYAGLARSDYAGAAALWKSALQESQSNQLQALLFTAPLTTSSAVWLGDAQFPVAHLTAVQELVVRQAGQSTSNAVQLALCEIERGDAAAAATALQAVLETSLDSPLRPLVRIYWFCLKGELLDQTPPEDRIPMEESLFAPEP